MSDYLLLPGYERVPAREWLEHVADLDAAAIVVSADGLQRWTVGELRELAAKGQAIDVPRVLPTKGRIWEAGT